MIIITTEECRKEIEESAVLYATTERQLREATKMIDDFISEVEKREFIIKTIKVEYEKRLLEKDKMIHNLCKENNALQREVADLERRLIHGD